MILILNPRAGGGTAHRRWDRLSGRFAKRYGPCKVEIVTDRASLNRSVRLWFDAGERMFVAAGGDGTVNTVLNSILVTLTDREADDVTLGAVGLGSSNDFHKPIHPRAFCDGVPCSVDCASACHRDVGVVTFPRDKGRRTRYFLVNASVGLTAEANSMFNSPDMVLDRLKPISTPLAILYAALRTMAEYADRTVQISLNGSSPERVALTNLAILKSHYVSGSLRFPGGTALDGGLFSVSLAEALSFPERIRLFTGLFRGEPASRLLLQSWNTPSLEVSGTTPFSVEFDGEVTSTCCALFSLLRRRLKVCTVC